MEVYNKFLLGFAAVNIVLFCLFSLYRAYLTKTLWKVFGAAFLLLLILLPSFVLSDLKYDYKFELRIFGVLFFSVLLLQLKAVEGILKYRRFKKDGVECTATIIDYSTGYRGREYPVIEYTAQNGNIYKEYAEFDLRFPFGYKSRIGKKMKIFYDKNNPDNFVSGYDGAGYSLLFVLVGIFTFMFGAGYFSVLYEIIKNMFTK